MPLRPVLTSKRRPVHWWTAEIALLRSNCFSARRRYQRAARRVEAERATALQTEYRTLRKELRLAIRKAQEADWADMCRAVDNDPWGLPYRVVTRKIGRSPAGMEARGKEGEIAGHLFPNLSATDWTTAPSPEEPLLDVGTPEGHCNMHILLRNNNTHIPESYKEKRTKNNYCTHKLK
jgi:hypothetical protein